MEIINENCIEFDFPKFEFIIKYVIENDYYIVEAYDEEKYPDDIILDSEDFEITEKIELFNGYILTKEKFEIFDKLVKEEKENL